jgi:hypothetical protein
MATGTYTLAYEELTEDCSEPRPGRRGSRDNLDLAQVRACLEAFAAIPSIALTDVEAIIRLRDEHRRIAITRAGGTMYYTLIPEAAHTPLPSSPEDILAFLQGIEPTRSAPAPVNQPVPAAKPPPRKSLFGLSRPAQVALMAGLLAAIGAVAYLEFFS